MPEPTSQRITLTARQAHDLAVRALLRHGYSADQAQPVAEHVVDAALCGYEYSGLPKILNLIEHAQLRGAHQRLRVLHETPISARLDGGNQNGMLAMHHVTEMARLKASEHGFAVVGIHNIWMSGRSAFYVERLAQAGLIGLHTVASRPQVAPPGAARPAIGTNPIALGFPTEGDPLLIDMGTSALMFTDLMFRQRMGLSLPEGVAIDAQGRPTTDAASALLGAVLPYGGHKGFALAVAMAALGVAAGSGQDPDQAGYLLMAIRPDLLQPLAQYRHELSLLIERIRATPRQPGADAIRIPSERAFTERRRRQEIGIELDQRVVDALLEAAGESAAFIQA
jgi:LDH2 family malate/lactate/ureidoglycolate dehydrogenase